MLDLPRAAYKKLFVTFLMQGNTPEGRRSYIYLQMRLDKALLLRVAMAGKLPIEMEKYGTILASGFGDPPPEVREYMEREHGVNHAKAQPVAPFREDEHPNLIDEMRASAKEEDDEDGPLLPLAMEPPADAAESSKDVTSQT
jgi:hypothetical protein